MKTLVLLLCVIAVSAIANSQEIPKGANLITFESDSLTNFDLFKECIIILKDEGYTFDQIDKDFYLCSTKPTQDKNSEYRIDLSVSNNKVTIRSYVRLLMEFKYQSGVMTSEASTDQPYERGSNRSLQTSLWRYGWNKNLEFANKLKERVSGTLNYIIETTK